MQALNQNKPLAVRPHKDRRLLPLFHDAGCKRLTLLRIKGLPPLYGHIDILDRNHLLFHHCPDCSNCMSCRTQACAPRDGLPRNMPFQEPFPVKASLAVRWSGRVGFLKPET